METFMLFWALGCGTFALWSDAVQEMWADPCHRLYKLAWIWAGFKYSSLAFFFFFALWYVLLTQSTPEPSSHKHTRRVICLFENRRTRGILPL